MKTYKILMPLLCILFLFAGCKEYDVDLPSASDGSVLSRISNVLWYSSDEATGLYAESYYAPSGLMGNEVAYSMSTGSSMTMTYHIEELGKDSYKLIGFVANMETKAEILSANHVRIHSFSNGKFINTINSYRITKVLSCNTNSRLRASDFGVSSLNELTILQELMVRHDTENDVFVPVGSGAAFVMVNSTDPYVIKLEIFDNNTAESNGVCFMHYEYGLGKIFVEAGHLFGTNYMSADGYANTYFYSDMDVYQGVVDLMAFDIDVSTGKINQIWFDIRDGVNSKDVETYLDATYKRVMDNASVCVYIENGESLATSSFVVTYSSSENQILFRSNRDESDSKPHKWVLLGKTEYTDPFFCGGAFPEMHAIPYNVEIMEDENHPGLYKLNAPYGKACTYLNPVIVDYTEDHDIIIDATNPDYVYVPECWTGVTLDGDKIYASDYVSWSMSKGFALQEIINAAPDFFGKKTADRIVIPKENLLLHWGEEPDEYYVANPNSDFVLKIPSSGNTDGNNIDRTDFSEDENLNRQNVRNKYITPYVNKAKQMTRIVNLKANTNTK